MKPLLPPLLRGSLPRAAKRPIALIFDTLLLLLSTWMALSLRHETLWHPLSQTWWAYLLAPALALPLFARYGLYRAIYRYSGLATLVTVTKSVTIFGLAYAAVLAQIDRPEVPMAVGLLQPVLTLVLIGGWRAVVRLVFGSGVLRKLPAREQVLIYGAGRAGRELLSALHNNPQIQVRAFIDDDSHLDRSSINGVEIHGPSAMPDLIERYAITDVLLAIPSLSRARRNEIIDGLRSIGVHVRTLPGVMDLARGKVQASDLRELDIEDLLSRDPVQPDLSLMARRNAGKVVLVTGAGGSIGSELCRQIARTQPAKLLLVEHSEFALYTIHQELLQRISCAMLPHCELVPLLCSVRDEARLQGVMEHFRPHTVYHAAAYKHVPIVEHNMVEGVRNNVVGTLTAARCARRAGVSHFVLISTDKAVRPTNIMGASKRLAEMALQAMWDDESRRQKTAGGRAATHFSMVRFGNVLDSSGSVVPLFRQQIRNGGPITLTHPEVTRYFMTIPEAAQLVLQAGAMAQGGEVFVLDMGNPVRIFDLARRMIELTGLMVKDEFCPHGDIEIVITGLRPGEKLYEELLIGENPLPTAHPRIMKAHETFLPWRELQHRLDELERLCVRGRHDDIVQLMRELVTGFSPSSAVVDWLYDPQQADFSEMPERETGTVARLHR